MCSLYQIILLNGTCLSCGDVTSYSVGLNDEDMWVAHILGYYAALVYSDLMIHHLLITLSDFEAIMMLVK